MSRDDKVWRRRLLFEREEKEKLISVEEEKQRTCRLNWIQRRLTEENSLINARFVELIMSNVAMGLLIHLQLMKKQYLILTNVR